MSLMKKLDGIEHLDFDIEEEEKKELSHHIHPTLPGYTWCGLLRPKCRTHMSLSGEKTVNTYVCPKCTALSRVYRYWDLHRAKFGSNCGGKDGIAYHDCGV